MTTKLAVTDNIAETTKKLQEQFPTSPVMCIGKYDFDRILADYGAREHKAVDIPWKLQRLEHEQFQMSKERFFWHTQLMADSLIKDPALKEQFVALLKLVMNQC